MTWTKSHVAFQQPALEAAFLDYVHEVEHAAERIQRLEKALDDAIAAAPPQIQEVVEALQGLRGVGIVRQLLGTDLHAASLRRKIHEAL